MRWLIFHSEECAIVLLSVLLEEASERDLEENRERGHEIGFCTLYSQFHF